MKKPMVMNQEQQAAELSTGQFTPKQSVAPIGSKRITREELAKQIERRRARDEEKISIIFRNRENPATASALGVVRFSYKMYPGQQNEFYELIDGERYSLPRGVINHLNNNCFFREYSHMSGELGEKGIRTGMADGRLRPQSNMTIMKKIHRFECVNMEFMDDGDELYPSNLIEVTTGTHF